MKKSVALVLALLMMALTAGCGDGTETKEANLTDFYSGLEETYEWGDGYMVDLEGELLEEYYAGISEISTKQLVIKVPMISAVVNEIVLAECETEEGADEMEALLQKRIDDQVGTDTNPGGAMYPDSIAAWKQAKVVRHGSYVALIASENQEEIVRSFDELFA